MFGLRVSLPNLACYTVRGVPWFHFRPFFELFSNVEAASGIERAISPKPEALKSQGEGSSGLRAWVGSGA